MSLQVIEGTWEEIECRKAELAGHRLRVTVKPEDTTLSPTKTVSKKKLARVLDTEAAERRSAFGKYAFVSGSSEEYAHDKQAEIEREDKVHG